MAGYTTTPRQITGGCACEALRYQVDFPDLPEFFKTARSRRRATSQIFPQYKSPSTCQCITPTNSSSIGGGGSFGFGPNTATFFFPAHRIPSSSFRWTSRSTSTLREYRATASASRSFCRECGSFLFWTRPGSGKLSITIGSVDPWYMVNGEGPLGGGGGGGTGGVLVPAGGYGTTTKGKGGHNHHHSCRNEVPGITDQGNFGYRHGMMV